MDGNKQVVRLYLAKGATEDSNIYVDTVPLPQHQYDGVRFLYRQFKKAKEGVVLNDPSGYGKRVQTVVFLNAVSPISSLPTLVLCPEGREDVWMHLFRQWTNIGSDVTVQHGNEYTKSMGLIGNFSQIYTLARREWGILVVDDCTVSREVLRSGITARYRIWITTIDMKKNLQTFSLIYKWLYPRDRFLVEDFQCSRKKPSDMLIKSSRLDAFMEDIVIRRRDVTVPLGTPHNTTDPPRVSRKNKDATGKKIKRSKPLPVNDHDINVKSQVTVTKDIPQIVKNGEVSKCNETVEDFKVNLEDKTITDNDHERIPSDIFSECKSTEEFLKDKSKNKDNIQVETNINADLNDSVDKLDPKSNLLNTSNLENVNLSLLNNDTIDSQNIVIKYDFDTPDSDDDVPAKKLKNANDDTSFTSNKINEISASEDLFPMDTEPISDNTSENMINNNSNNVNTRNNASNTNNSENVPTATTGKLNNEMKVDDLNCSATELDKNNASENNKTESKLEGIELKMKQMEELAMKKFKGTFLDSIF